jgi:hypothetical protein
MQYVLWALLNIGLFIAFLFFCFKAAKLIRQEHGWVAVLVLVFGLLSYIAGTNTNDEDSNPATGGMKGWDFGRRDSMSIVSTGFHTFPLKKTLISTYLLGIEYGKEEAGSGIPLSGKSWTTGFISGTQWKPVSIMVNATPDNKKYAYEVFGTIRWRLLGFTIYDQSKTWRGEFVLK